MTRASAVSRCGPLVALSGSWFGLAWFCLAWFCLACLCGSAAAEGDMETQFQTLAAEYVDQVAKFSPVEGTGLGDHRFDGELDDISTAGRKRRRSWLQRVENELQAIEAQRLSRSDQVDLALLKHAVRFQLWQLDELREWEWNPLVYTAFLGDSVQRLLERDFAPEPERLRNVARRLQKFPEFLKEVRKTLVPARVPEVHAETASAQNRGLFTILERTRERAGTLGPAEREELGQALSLADRALHEHQQWLDEELRPGAKGDFRLGRDLFDRKLAFTLHSNLTRDEIRDLAEQRVRTLHEEMYALAGPLLRSRGSTLAIPESPDPEQKRGVIRAALELASADAPEADEIVATIQASVRRATQFVRDKDLVTLAPDPLEIVLMPEFRRGVSAAYCDAPGPLETNQKTFYAVSPIPKSWTAEQAGSFLREYNRRSLDVLTIHEAMPGHFLQLALSNRHPGRLRHLLQSGVFIEGWAVYTEGMMSEAGFRDGDPLLKLVTLKWYLRDATNALLDQAVHVGGMSRAEAMRLLMEDAFQEEREAAGKWRRAQLTSAQLSTYFTGYLEHVALRKEAERRAGPGFRLKHYHDQVLSFGSPAPQFVRALMFDEPIPER